MSTGIIGGKYDYETVKCGAHGNLRILINLRGCHANDDFISGIKTTLGMCETKTKLH